MDLVRGPGLAAQLGGGHVVSAGHVAPGGHLALGGGGLASLIVHLIIWHELFRLVRFLWHIHTFGPYIVVVLAVALVGLAVWRRSRGPLRWGRRRGGSAGWGSGTGPRDW
jgi:hypothetical protein